LSEKGAIFLHRQIQDHYLWKDKPFTMGQAWIDMLLRANHEKARVLYRREFYEIDRGQFIRTERDLAHDWGWSRSKITRFLVLLKKDLMIDTKPNPKANLVTILNYNDYQILRTNNKPKLNQSRTNSEPIVNLNNNEKNEKNEKKNINTILPNWFPQETWDMFVAHRKASKAPVAKGTESAFLKKFQGWKDQGYEPQYIVDTMIDRGWRSFKPEWVEKDGGRNGKPSRTPKPDGFADKQYTGSDISKNPIFNPDGGMS